MNAHQKLEAIRQELRSLFYEREAIIDGLLVGLIARLHVFLLGTPGVAKSAVVNALAGAIVGASIFDRQLRGDTPPEALFGPVDLKRYKEAGEYVHRTTGMLPEAHIALLDETFKANATCLNGTLQVLNERKFSNGPVVQDCPLEFGVGASNELGEGTELAAFFDRFALRFVAEDIRDEDKLKALLLAPYGEVKLNASITLDEIHDLQAKALNLPVDGQVVDMLLQIRRSLADKGITASPRRWRHMLQIVRARAVLAGSDMVLPEHLEILSDGLWAEPDQRDVVTSEVGKVANPMGAKAVEFLDMVTSALDAYPETITDDNVQVAARVRREVRQIRQKAERLVQQTTNGTGQRLVDAVAEIKTMQSEMARRMATYTGDAL